jgi:A/G-specific adenine glycosylase
MPIPIPVSTPIPLLQHEFHEFHEFHTFDHFTILKSFAIKVVQWQMVQGRNHLPWQQSRDPYRVWLSEIMLQQTQVATVLGYFERFTHRFPDLASLAHATQDEVLGLWSGLGYYTRAHNLLRCAQQITGDYGGIFPRTAAQLETLPGIGRSTAAAIASQCFGERVAILDANVKRVIARVAGFEGDLAQAANLRQLWQIASDYLPSESESESDSDSSLMPRYTQGMMDIGAMVCLPNRPRCGECPVQTECAGAASDPQRYPVSKRKIKRSSQALWLLWAQKSDGSIYLHKRPAKGIWANLHCLPVFDSESAVREALPPEWQPLLRPLPAFAHVLTHKDLQLNPCQLLADDAKIEWQNGRWVAAQNWKVLGLPAPIRKLLELGSNYPSF